MSVLGIAVCRTLPKWPHMVMWLFGRLFGFTASFRGISLAENSKHQTPQTLNPEALNPETLNPEALNPEALNPEALNPEALNPEALNPEALSPEALNPVWTKGVFGVCKLF